MCGPPGPARGFGRPDLRRRTCSCVHLAASMAAAVMPTRPATPTASGAPMVASLDAGALDGVKARLRQAETRELSWRVRGMYERALRGM
jgi:hypothetical protein